VKVKEELKPLSVKIQNVVSSAIFKQPFDLKFISDTFPSDTEAKGRFPGLVYRLKKPKAVMLIFNTGKIVCAGAKSEEESRFAIRTFVKNMEKKGIKIAEEPDIQITNIVASATLSGFIDLEKLYMSEIGKMRGKIIFEPDQFPALIYRLENPYATFLIFSTGKIVCAGAKGEKDSYKAIETLMARLHEGGFMVNQEN